MAKQKWSEAELTHWKQWKVDRDPQSGNYLVRKYASLIDYVVNRFAVNLPATVSKDDLKSYGFSGLMDALDKFDLDRGLQFETYACWRIKGAMIDGLRQMDWIPRTVREKARRVEEAYTYLEQSELRSVSDQEVSRYLDMPEEDIRQVLVDASLAAMLSIDEPVYDEDDQHVSRYNVIQNDQSESPEQSVHHHFVKQALAEAIGRLPEKEKLIVSLVYYEEMNLTEIASIMDLSTSRISQLHSKALLRLNQTLAKSKQHMYSTGTD